MLFELFNHQFMVFALIIGLSLGVGAALISSFLVLNNESMIADGLSHVAFTGVVFGLLSFPNQPLLVALPIAVAASILITYLGQLKMVEHDAAIGVVSALALAIGIITISVSGNAFNTSIESLLTGSILASSLTDVIVSLVTLVGVFVFILVFYRKLLSLSYDATYAKFSKIRYQILKYLLSAISAIFIVIGVRTVGMLLLSSFVIFPSLIAAQISKSFKQNVIISVIVAFSVILVAIFTSFNLSIYDVVNLPTGAAIVVTYSLCLFGAIIYRKIRKKV